MTKKKSNDIIEEFCKEYLKYTFTEDEIKEMGKSLAKLFSDYAEAEASLKSVSTKIKAELAVFEGNMTLLSEKIRSGYEHRDIECKKEFDYRLGTVTITRNDTGEVVEERPMDVEEKQRKLNLLPKE